MNKKMILFSICLIASTIILSSLFLANISYAADSNSVSQNDIIKSSNSVHNFINTNDRVPETIKVANKTVSSEQFLYLMSKTVLNKKNNIKTNVTIKSNIKKAIKPDGTNINGQIYLKDMYNYSQRLVVFMDNNNRAPNFMNTDLGTMRYETIVLTFSKFLSQTDSNGKLTNKITMSSITVSPPKKSIIVNNGYTLVLFSDYKNGDSLQKYLSSTKNAPSNDTYIKDLANQITKNSKTSLSKAEAIFDWVKTNIQYSKYGGTKYGGINTIKNRQGNCVDNSHALVSLLRASNIPVRYVNGKCEFTKGDLAKVTVAHVWTQVLIDGKWMVADGIYKENKLGYVTNWKPNTYTLYGYYSSI